MRTFYIVWSPDSKLPPTKKMSRPQAEVVARKMAKKHKQKFFVMATDIGYGNKKVYRPVPYTERW